jgi:citrate synthase
MGAEIRDILKEHGNKKIGEVTLSQIYQGMRGMTDWLPKLPCSMQMKVSVSGLFHSELQEKLPRAKDGSEPLPEGLFYLMLIGELPNEEDVNRITSTLQRRSHVPNYVFDTIESLPISAHQMTQFVVGIMALQTESQFF